MSYKTYQQCQVCDGTGGVYIEDSNGTPVQSVTCPYCRGRGQQRFWVAGQDETRFRRRGPFHISLWCVTVIMLLTNDVTAWNTSGSGPMGPSWLVALHCVLWVLLVAGWVVWLKNRGPKTQHAPGFTDNRERIMLGVLGVGLMLKWQHDTRVRRQYQQQQEILSELQQLNQRQGGW